MIGDNVCNIGLDRESGVLQRINYEHIPVHFPGTGDIFASVLTGSLLQNDDLPTAIKRATKFARTSVKVTHEAGGECRNGVMFEGLLHKLR